MDRKLFEYTIEPTRAQIEKLELCYDGTKFICPSCKSCGGQNPKIENAGEDYAQIYCAYCMGYVEL